ncbi:MAG: hypothetical protein HOH74_00800, partial [Gemmatimonadetes bacterium]|nr:hypothetical protein [Gemmatimonadota bacterium]
GLRPDYLGYDVYPYPPYSVDRYIRYGAANQGRRAVYDRLGQFVSYGSYGLQWSEMRDSYTQAKVDAGIPLGNLNAHSGALIQNSFFQFLAVARQTYGEEAMSIAVGRNLASSFTPLVVNQMQYGGLRIDYASRRHDLTILFSRGGTLETTLWSNLRGNERDVREMSPVLVGGANWIGHFGNADVGATFYRQLQSNIKSDRASLWRGDVPYMELKPPKQITVRVRDDSPRDGGGAAVYDASILLVAVVDSTQRRYTSDSEQAGTDVFFDPGMVRLQGISGRQVGSHWEAAEDEFIDIVFTIDADLAAIDADIEVLADGDYLIEVRQLHDFDVPGSTNTVERSWPSDPPQDGYAGTFFEDYLRQDEAFFTVARSDGRQGLDGAPKRVRINYGIPTAQSFYGASLKYEVEGLTLDGEIVHNPQEYKFPTAKGRRSTESGTAGYLTAQARFGRYGNVGAEVFRIEPNYGGSYDSRRGGLVLFTDTAGDVQAGESRGVTARTQEYKAFDDNDDHDNWPDDMPGSGDALYMPRGTFQRPAYLARKPEGGVFPGFDMDGDLVVDFDRNRNTVDDYLEPFLGYDSMPPDFDFGIDFNNNLIPDYRENDDHPDYPYRRDQRGWHFFYDVNRRPWWLSEARLGAFGADEISGGHQSRVQYSILGVATEAPSWWTKARNVLKRVEDDIPDDVYRLVLSEDIEINSLYNEPSRTPPRDFLPMRKSVVNTAWIETGWLPARGLSVSNTFKYVVNRRGDVDGEGEDAEMIQKAGTDQNFSMVNKVSYQRELQPQLILTARAKHLLARWDEGSYSPVDSTFGRIDDDNDPETPTVLDHRLGGHEASWSLFTPELLLSYSLTRKTRIEFGQHGLFLPFLRARYSDREFEINSYTQNVSILQLSMSGEHGGYNLVAHVGLRRDNRYLHKDAKAAGRKDTDMTAFFVDVIFGVQ